MKLSLAPSTVACLLLLSLTALGATGCSVGSAQDSGSSTTAGAAVTATPAETLAMQYAMATPWQFEAADLGSLPGKDATEIAGCTAPRRDKVHGDTLEAVWWNPPKVDESYLVLRVDIDPQSGGPGVERLRGVWVFDATGTFAFFDLVAESPGKIDHHPRFEKFC